MQQIVNVGLGYLNNLWESLKCRALAPRLERADKLFTKFSNSGWTFINDFDDVLDALDSRLNFRTGDVISFAALLDIKSEMVCFYPRARESSPSFFKAIRVEEAAYILIILERLGFMTFPERLIDLILPALKSRKQVMLTCYELDVLRYHSLRHKDLPLRFIHGERVEMNGTVEEWRSLSGYKIEAFRDSEGRVAALTSTAPKYRQKAIPVLVNCAECGFLYEKGDPDADYQHRQAHKKVMYYLKPLPNKRFLNERLVNADPELVRSDSPKWKHKEMYICARAFNREMGYETILWGAEGDDDPQVHGYLFADDSGKIVGACSFRNRTEIGRPELWALQWVWVCPTERRNGHMSSRWPAFRKRFKDFFIEAPVSKEMEAFLIKQNDEHLMIWPYKNIEAL